MIDDPDNLSRCAVCGTALATGQEECPVCNPSAITLHVESCEQAQIVDHVELSVNLSTTSVDFRSGVSATTSTTLPPEILSQAEPEREVAASELMIKADRNLRTFEPELPRLIHDLLETCEGSGALQKGPISVFVNCQINAGSIGGNLTTIEVTLVNTWNAMKDTVDIEALRSDLRELIRELAERANSKDDYASITETGSALDELEKANGAGMLGHLKRAGKWVLDVASETGKDVAAKVLAEVILKL